MIIHNNIVIRARHNKYLRVSFFFKENLSMCKVSAIEILIFWRMLDWKKTCPISGDTPLKQTFFNVITVLDKKSPAFWRNEF